jgi:hypothetical protein
MLLIYISYLFGHVDMLLIDWNTSIGSFFQSYLFMNTDSFQGLLFILMLIILLSIFIFYTFFRRSMLSDYFVAKTAQLAQ